MKNAIIAVMCVSLILSTAISSCAQLSLENIESAILIEAQSGKVLYEKEPDVELFPASVTKVMTMLLIMESIDSGKLKYDDMVVASLNAASMGGSQVYLEEGEQFSVSDMLKCITMASANDACVAMAEHIAGSEESFVAMMNTRARQLGMTHTSFQNTNGLDDTVTQHYTTARDISIMSRELINNHPKILEYSSKWMDSVRDGTFALTNTNRLVRFYNGANGLKTGSTSKAGFCISASAKRDDMQLIAVIMKATDRDTRNEAAKKLFDYGFANYSTVSYDADTVKDQHVYGAEMNEYDFYIPPYSDVVPKGATETLERKITLKEKNTAPLKSGDKVGVVEYIIDDKVIHTDEILVSSDINRITLFGIVTRLFSNMISL